MKLERRGGKLSQEKRIRIMIICALSILCLSQPMLAQSGRRPPKRESPPPPQAPAETRPEPAPETPAEKPGPAAYLIVGGDRFGSSMDIPSVYADNAVDACLSRLKKSPSLSVRPGGNMTRGDAINIAKKEKDAHVVWLEIRADNNRAEGISIGYTVFKPQTAQVKTSGRVYLDGRSVGSGRVGIPLPGGNRRLPLEYQMSEGGKNVADRLMKNFEVPLPPDYLNVAESWK